MAAFLRHRFQPLLHLLLQRRLVLALRRRSCAAPLRRHGRQGPAAACALPERRSPRRVPPRLRRRRRPPPRAVSTRSRAASAASRLRSGRRRSGKCGRATSSAASSHGQPPRLLAEIGKACGAHAFQIAAIGRMRQIKIEDLVLRQPPLDLDGARHLQEFRRKRTSLARLDQPRHLHRKRRGAGDDAAVGDELQRRAPHRQRIDAVMLVEAPVLIGDQHAQELRIDIRDRRLQPPAAFRRRKGPKQLPVGIQHFASTRRPPCRAAADMPCRPQSSANRAAPASIAAGSSSDRELVPEAALWRRHDLHLAGCGARRKLGAVHVLDGRRRMVVDAGRDGAHDIGDVDLTVVVRGPVEGRNEAIVAELGMCRRLSRRSSRNS